MERLSEKRDGQNVIPLRQDGANKWAICSAGIGEAPTHYLYGDHAGRLAAYEDTGLTPEEVKELALKVATLETIEAMYEGLGRPDHLRSLVESEQEGRIVILPCKVGDIVYGAETEPVIPLHVIEHAVYLESAECGDFEVLSNFGKTVFLTREEAEAALAGKGGESDA